MRASYPGRMVMLWKSRLIMGVQTIREVPLRPKQGRLGMCKVLSLEKHTTAGLQKTSVQQGHHVAKTEETAVVDLSSRPLCTCSRTGGSELNKPLAFSNNQEWNGKKAFGGRPLLMRPSGVLDK